MDRNEIGVDEMVTVQVDVTNTGDVAGDEVVQLYVSDVNSSVVRPKQELKGFRRIHLAAGQRATITFELAAAQLGFQDGTDFVVGLSLAELPLAETMRV